MSCRQDQDNSAPFFLKNFIILYSAVLGHDSLSTPRTPKCPVPPHYPPDCKRKETQKATQKATSYISLILRPRRLARPVLILLLILTVLPRYGPADTRASKEVQHSWAALFFNKELGYLDLPFPLLGLLPDLCLQDGLLGFPLLAALEQLLARLLNSAVAPPTGVAGALADLLEERPDEGVPRPELVEALAQARLHP